MLATCLTPFISLHVIAMWRTRIVQSVGDLEFGFRLSASSNNLVFCTASRPLLDPNQSGAVSPEHGAGNSLLSSGNFRHWVVHLSMMKINKVIFALEQATKAHRVVEVQVWSSCNLGARWGWVVSTMPRRLFCRKREAVPIVRKAGWASGPVLAGRENYVPSGVLIPDRPAPSVLLYGLRYPSRMVTWCDG
jgi:hypothetical protein